MVSLWASFLGFVWVNKDIKDVMVTRIPRNQMGLMIARCLSGAAAHIIQFTISKYLSLIFIGLAQNSAPLVTIVLSRIMTGEQIKKIDIVMIVITFIGVSLLSMGD